MILLGTGCRPQHETSPQLVLSIQDYEKLLPGDLILRQGNGIFSSLITNTLQDGTNLTHVGVLYSVGQEWLVLHTLSSTVSDQDGIRLESLRSFLSQTKGSSLVVLRPRFDNESQRRLFLDAGLSYHEQRVPFDLHFDWSNQQALYCSELVFRMLASSSFNQGGVEYIQWKAGLPLFSSFFHSELFQVILDLRE